MGEKMKPETIHVDAQNLKAFTAAVFERAGVPAEDAALEAEVLIWANLRGVDSHGVLRIPWYLAMIESGQMNTHPQMRTLKETPAVLFVDADRALGPVATVPVMHKVMEKAANVGIGWGLIRNVTHQGAIGYYAQMAADADMLGITIVCSPPNMAPFGARAAGVHNSPIAIAAPAERYPPLILDMATSVAAGGKLDLARDKGVPLGPDWALDAIGEPTTDPHAAAILLPTGGPKGSGLALMFQTLTSLLGNNPLVTPVLRGEGKALRGEGQLHNQNSVVAAIDISLFADVKQFRTQVDEHIEVLKSLPTAEGHTEVLMPGEPEQRILAERQRIGIPLPPGTIEKLRQASARTGVALPDTLAS